MEKVVQVHGREWLLSLDAIYGLAERLDELNLPRRQVIEWVTRTLYDYVDSGGIILTGDGEELEIYPGVVDDAHGDDGSAIWISEQRRRLANPPKRKPRKSMLWRLELYDAAFRIATGRSIMDEPAIDDDSKGDGDE